MTNNLDEFDQDDTAGLDDPTIPAKGGVVSGIVNAWHSKPLFKLFVVIVAVAAAVVVSLNISASKKDNLDNSRFVKAPELSEAPGGKASPYFVEQNKQATNQRIDNAMKQGGSAMPTPVGQSLDIGDLNPDKNSGPAQEYKSEAERLRQELRQEQIQNAKQLQKMQAQQQAPKQEREDDSLARAMQSEMSRLMQSWTPKGIAMVSGAGGGNTPAAEQASMRTISAGQSESVQDAMKSSATDGMNDKLLITAGTVNYGQLLIEANSDVPGPILAQIVSGPMTGGRAIGEFKVQEDYLVLHFRLVNYKGTDYSVDALALNPNTTLGGMATEVDPRYGKRLLLPAAAAFMTGFSSEMTNDGSTTTVSDGVVITTQAGNGAKEGLYNGISSAGDSISQFLKSEANRTKQLVRIAAGTPMGLFFTSSVYEQSSKTSSRAAMGSGNGQWPGNTQGYIDQNGNIVYGQGASMANPPIYYNNTGYNTGLPTSTYNTGLYNTGNPGSTYRSGNVTVTYPSGYNGR